MTILPNIPFRPTHSGILNRAQKTALLIAAVCFVLQTVPLHATINVVSYWRLGESDPGAIDGGATTVAIDSVGVLPLTFNAAAHYSADVSPSASLLGSFLSVNFPNLCYASNAIVTTNIDNFGLECWVKPATSNPNEIIAYNGAAALGIGGWGLSISSSNTYSGLIAGSGFGTNAAVPNVWTHLALVRDSGIATLYVNGVASATSTNQPLPPTQRFAVGGFPLKLSPEYFTGLIDEVRVFTFTPGQFSPNDLLYNQSSVDTTNLLEPNGAVSDSLNLETISPSFSWTNVANVGWLHLSQLNGTGFARINFSVDANPGGPRTGTMTIGGHTVTITQAGLTYVSATQIGTLFTNIPYALGLAADPSGYVYASYGPAIYKWSPGNTSATQLINSGLNAPAGLALDTANNLYIANSGGSYVSKWIAASNSLTTLFSSGIPYPDHLGRDFAGNVYFVCSQNSVSNYYGPFKWSSLDGSLTPVRPGPYSTDQTFLSLAVDAASDIFYGYRNYIAHLNETFYVVDERTAGGSVVSYGSERTGAVAVDGGGSVYVSDITSTNIYKISPSHNLSTVVTGAAPLAMATDSARNFYYGGAGILELPRAFLDPSPQSVPVDGGSGQLPPVLWVNANFLGNFYPTADQSWISITGVTNGVVYYSVGANTGFARSGNISLLGRAIPVQQASAVYTLGTTNLLEGSASGSDSIELSAYPQVAAWTVTTSNTWLHPVQTNGVGSTNLTFTFDQNPGATRVGNLMVAGQMITITQAGAFYVQASEAGWLASGATNSHCLAVDAIGNGYFLATNGVISEWSLTNQTVTGLVSNLFDPPGGLAVDQTGDIYFSDPSNHAVFEWAAGSGAVSTVVSNGTMVPLGVALDSAGNVYFSDASDKTIKMWTATNGLTTIVTNGLSGPVGVAVDTMRNVYIADTAANSIMKWTAGGGGLSVFLGGLLSPQGVAVDGSGNVYVAQTNGIYKWTLTSGAFNAMSFPGLNASGAVAVDDAQNVYAVDSVNGSVEESPLAFVNIQGRQEPVTNGSDVLPVVLPPSANLGGSFTPASDQSWLTISGVTNGLVNFSFTAYGGASNRVANINLLGQPVVILQGPPSARLGVDHRLEGPAAGADSVLLALTTHFGAWTSAANDPWLHLDVSAQSGNFDTNIIFSFDANPGPTRTGTLTVEGQIFTVIQAGSNYVQAGALTVITNDQYVSDVATDRHGNVYYAVPGDYINKWTPSNQEVTVFSATPAGAGLSCSDDGVLCTSDEYFYNPILRVYYGPNANQGFTIDTHTFPYNPAMDVWSAVADDLGNIYCTVDTGYGSMGSLIQFSLANNWTTNYYYLLPPPNYVPKVLASNYNGISGLARDRAGNLYFGSANNVSKWTAYSQTLSVLNTSPNPADIKVDGSGNLYLTYSYDGSVEKYTAATQTHAAIVTGLYQAFAAAVDEEQNVYIADYRALNEIPYVFVDPTPITVAGNVGSGALPQILPATANLFGPFVPTNDQPWLTITGTSNGVVTFTVTANTTGTNRTAHIRLFNQTIPVTQSILITPPVLTNPTFTNGTFGFTFTNNQTTNFSVLYSTNLSLPLSNWFLLGVPSNISPGVFLFTTPATKDPQGFYRVSSP